MPHDPDQPSPRRVRSEDPSLSREANRLLTDELQEVIGSDTAQVPSSRTTRLTGEAEHVDPATAAALEEEGVGDPGRALTDFTPPAPTVRDEVSA